MRIKKKQLLKDNNDPHSNQMSKLHRSSRGEKGASPAEVGALASAFEKSATELKQKLLKCKHTIQIATFNVRTLDRIGQLPELTASTIDHNIGIICIQEHRHT